MATTYKLTVEHSTQNQVIAQKADVVGLWGLDQGLDLSRACCDYYLLLDLQLDGLDEGKFKSHQGFLVNQFQAYTDMILGGELRHSTALVKGKSHIAKPMKEALSTVMSPGVQRVQAWRAWYYLRQSYGVQALHWAIDVFLLFTGGGYGGVLWANIAKHLLEYEQEHIGADVFVDFCWGLQHNGGSYFNKVWEPPSSYLLDAKRESDMPVLLTEASPIYAQFWHAKRTPPEKPAPQPKKKAKVKADAPQAD